VHVVAVGLCQPAEARSICGARAPHLTCLCDRTKAAYAAYGLVEGTTAELFGPAPAAAYARAALQGYFVGGGTAPDTWRMLPGTFAVDAEGIIRAVHYARHPGDQPDLPAMLAALRRA